MRAEGPIEQRDLDALPMHERNTTHEFSERLDRIERGIGEVLAALRHLAADVDAIARRQRPFGDGTRDGRGWPGRRG